ncbi:MAG: DUF4390 domain-containing protein [Nitrosomonadales bacterium]|nr:DUF4390 domain-containing protein [Nitrosomonadales bacterium]
MRYFKKAFSVLLRSALLVGLLLTSVYADDVFVNKSEMRSGEEGYQIYVDYDIKLTDVVQQALSRGIPIYFVSEFSLKRSRWYWLDEEIFLGQQTVKLSYSVLTRQYRISRGALFQNFASLDDALDILSRQSSDFIPAEAMQKSGDYTVAVRLRLDTTQLPKLFQVNMLTGKDWTLDSGWYRWVIRPDENNASSDSKAG